MNNISREYAIGDAKRLIAAQALDAHSGKSFRSHKSAAAAVFNDNFRPCLSFWSFSFPFFNE